MLRTYNTISKQSRCRRVLLLMLLHIKTRTTAVVICPTLVNTRTDRQINHHSCLSQYTAYCKSKSNLVICIAGNTTAKVLRYGPCVTRGSHGFTCHPHTNHTCLYCPATRHHRPLAGTHCTYPRRVGQAE